MASTTCTKKNKPAYGSAHAAKMAATAGKLGKPFSDGHHLRLTSMMDPSDIISEVDKIMVDEVGMVNVPIVKGFFLELPLNVQKFIAKYVSVCQPKGVYICDGSKEECDEITEKLVERGLLIPLEGMENCYACRTDPADVARVESKTFIVTENKYDSVPHVKEGVKGSLGQWKGVDEMKAEMETRLPGSMRGRVMYVIPFSMGPIGGPLSKIGVQLTDFNYVILSMNIMTRVSSTIWDHMEDTTQFVQCVHTIGAPRPLKKVMVGHWPDDAEHIIISHYPGDRRVISYGSGYGGNSLLGKKCFALRIASCIGRDEGWLAEHMLIMSVTNPEGKEKFIAAAFPSACGKTNLAMLTPTLPGWKVRVVGDDIAWMRFNDQGELRAINPENGFFGVAPGTNSKSNLVAMQTCMKNTIFTNVGVTDDGKVFWEGLEKEVDPNIGITTWRGEKWKIGDPGNAAHPNSRFCTPAKQCPIIHPNWESPEGVPISAIIFGGRRPAGVPLVFETRSWKHGVLTGAACKSEATAAAEDHGKQIMHDPMAMRPFMGYNFGKYLQHWLSLEKEGRKMPKIYHVNWFRVNKEGKFLWPGFGENIRVIDWICKRVDGDDSIAVESSIGLLPKEGSINMDGIPGVNWKELFDLPKDYWLEDILETKKFLEEQVGSDLPEDIRKELDIQVEKIRAM